MAFVEMDFASNAVGSNNWTYFGSGQGNAVVNLPQDYKEIHIVVKYKDSSNANCCANKTFIREELTSDGGWYYISGGYYKTSSKTYSNFANMFISDSTVKLNAYDESGTSVLSSCTLDVYYR